ncbi:unnamed protein product [Musa acuminata var. zebrina]
MHELVHQAAFISGGNVAAYQAIYVEVGRRTHAARFR